jgi:transcriptional regulator with XRE-family HTH domain
MAEQTGVTLDTYLSAEEGGGDLSLSFLFKCAEELGIELIELLTGSEPRLQKYTVVRSGEGLPINRREGFSYRHLAYLFKHKNIEPLIVTAPFSAEEQDKPMHMSRHDGQEWDYILSGQLRYGIGEGVNYREEILNPGDSVYYNSANPHGMIAANGSNCVFLAVLIG